MSHEKIQKKSHHAAGFTLIEVLVALVVMTVGMLGVAVLYVEGLQLNRTSLYRTTAVALASDMAERIRSNREADYNGANRPGAPGNCNAAPACSPDELADDDWLHWRQMLDAYLPNGYIAQINQTDAGPGNRMQRFDITLRWPEIGNPKSVEYSLTVQM